MLSVSPLAPSLGAEIKDVDLARPIEDDAMKAILSTLDQYGVVILRGQDISTQQFMDFSRRVGPLAIHSLKQFSKPGLPELMVASNIIENGKEIGLVDGGQHWHTDGAYLEKPYRATILYSLEIPMKDGVAIGDTLFAGTAAAYDALSDDMKERLAPLRALNCHGVARRKRGESLVLDDSHQEILKGIEQPVVRKHPVSGRKCLYVNPGSTASIVGYDERESDALLQTLFAHITQAEFMYRHNWRVGDIVMWDNCSTQHCAIGDYELPQRRLLHRTVVNSGAAF